MPIPAYQQIMLPALSSLNDGNVWSVRDMTKKMGELFNLSEEEREKLLPSGTQTVIALY